ncbi:DUF4209 domain-containing protein [Microbacterium hydrothermale]|uniref:DUF4209 domain-containing protein n=1 Tax=Microbacterium hydrothermale TaxID=857427 RepID=UPI0010A9060E|nr:DUF4209 domain-containing protein [Microbacterium hydrothermale]
MTDAGEVSNGFSDRWLAALRDLEASKVFRASPTQDEDRLPSLWLRLRAARDNGGSADVVELASLLSQVASFSPRADDWSAPYEPMLTMVEGRTAIPSDLTDVQIEVLVVVSDALPDHLLRARVYDVLAIRSLTGADRARWYQAEMGAVIEATLGGERWMRDRDMWDRALLVGRRGGKPMAASLQKLTQILIDHALTADLAEFPGPVADLLDKHGLARDRAGALAARMRNLASSAELEPARSYRERAARWHGVAGNSDEVSVDRLAVVNSLIAEAEGLSLGPDSDSHPRSAYLYERAMKALRMIPRKQREKLGVSALTTELGRRIRAAGAATLGTMGVLESESVDLSEARDHSVAAVSGKPALEALRAFVDLSSFSSLQDERDRAEKILAEHPLQTLFSNVHFASDGRVVHRSGGQGGEPIYGEDPATWRQMIQAYEIKVSLMVQGMLAPAWMALSNEHRLMLGDFVAIMRGSSIIPSDRELLIAQALYYGYDGDFLTSAQLLAPQIENMVRLHLRNAGQQTSTIDRGVEQEIGLTALMGRESVSEIFGEDIAFEIRALFCGPIGPNLRNNFAHGLVSDDSVRSVHAIYCWWFVLRLAFVPFWNRLHDARTADSHEPAERDRPSAREGETGSEPGP